MSKKDLKKGGYELFEGTIMTFVWGTEKRHESFSQGMIYPECTFRWSISVHNLLHIKLSLFWNCNITLYLLMSFTRAGEWKPLSYPTYFLHFRPYSSSTLCHMSTLRSCVETPTIHLQHTNFSCYFKWTIHLFNLLPNLFAVCVDLLQFEVIKISVIIWLFNTRVLKTQIKLCACGCILFCKDITYMLKLLSHGHPTKCLPELTYQQQWMCRDRACGVLMH